MSSSVTAYLGRALGQYASCIDDNNESKHQSGLKSAENVILLYVTNLEVKTLSNVFGFHSSIFRSGNLEHD